MDNDLASLVAKPEVWIALFALIGSVITYWKGRRADNTADRDRADRVTTEDWNRLRKLIEEARAETQIYRKEADILREEAEVLREDNKETRELCERLKTKEDAMVKNEFNLLNENVKLTKRVEELEAEVSVLKIRLTKFTKQRSRK